jgi:hypothetical protein
MLVGDCQGRWHHLLRQAGTHQVTAGEQEWDAHMHACRKLMRAVPVLQSLRDTEEEQVGDAHACKEDMVPTGHMQSILVSAACGTQMCCS